jgi:hypothetical protein
LIHSTFFESLCATDDVERSVTAVKSYLGFLLTLTPLGPFLEGIARIKHIFTGRIAEIRAADNLLSKLERWNEAALYWAISTRFLCHNLAHFKEPQHQIDVEEALSLIIRELHELKDATDTQSPNL